MKKDQLIVDGYAANILAAVASLVKRAPNLSINISGVATSSETVGQSHITWMAEILTDGGRDYEAFNELDVKFKSYGIYYGISEDAVADWENFDSDSSGALCKLVLDEGDDIDIYNLFGFRLKNILAGRDRAAMFFIEYEFDGETYIILSEIDVVTV